MDELSLAELRAPGLQAALAKSLGITPSAVSQWLSGRIPWNRCPDIERATDGRATCEVMRPDLRWARIPDAAWPHPDGRPCVDPAGASQCAAAEEVLPVEA